MTFPGKNWEGQFGFPTPDTTPETSACRTFRVPANDDWLGALMGAVELLMNERNWYNWGAVTPDEAAAAWRDIINQAYEDSLTLGCPVSEVEAPFWDTDSDVDDNAPILDQPWYGEVDDPTVVPTELTFRENAEIWTFAGLLAIAGAPGAALAYVTIAQRFVLAFKQNDIGKIIRVFVDASEVSSFTDDGSGDVREVSVAGDPDAETHQIYITVGDT